MRLVSVVIPAYNDAQRLEKTLRQLQLIRQQEYSALEVVVAVRPSADATLTVANRLAHKVVLGGTVSVGRNAGAAVASGEVIIFMDADTIPSFGVVSALAERVTKQMVGSVPAFTTQIGFRPHFAMWWTNTVRSLGLIKGMSNLLFCHRALLHEQGVWFDETVHLGEHHDFIRRACKVGGAHFTYLKIKPGYVVGVERYEQWGYAKSLIFWFHWAVRKVLLRRPVHNLEQAYWSKDYHPWSVISLLASLFGIAAGVGLSLLAYVGPQRAILFFFGGELVEDPTAPLVNALLYFAHTVDLGLVFGLGLGLGLVSLFSLMVSSKQLTVL